MSVCAIAMVRDEEDVIESFVRHMLANVDEMIVADNISADGTRPILDRLADEFPQFSVVDDPQLAYLQSRKMTALAMAAMKKGHKWVVPCDADEIWYATDGRPIADYLAGIGPDVQIVKADLYNHIPSSLDDDAETNIFRRIGWRQRQHGPLGKVACRLHPELVIHAGNHGAYLPGSSLSVGGMVIRHFSWRTAEQYLRKIRNGQEAYAATSLPETTGAHWRMFNGATDEAIMNHFRQWFFIEDPAADDSLIYDPAPSSA